MKMKGLSDLLRQFGDIPSYTGDKSSKSQNRSMQAGEVFDFLSMLKKWPEIVGPKLAEHTLPVKQSRGTLTVLTDHPAYGQELSFLQQPLIAKIEKFFPAIKGKITRLLFQNDPMFFKTKMEMMQKLSPKVSEPEKIQNAIKYHQHSPEYKAVKKEAELQFEHITDEEVKKSLISIYIQAKLT